MACPLTPNRREVLIGATAATLVAGITRGAPAKPTSAQAARANVANEICGKIFTDNKVPAFSVAVAGRDGPIWSSAYGKADIEMDVDARTTHLFQLSSVGKVVTATTVARMTSRGLLDIDAPIEHWLTDLPAVYRKTSLRLLLTHRSGIRHYIPTRDFSPNLIGGTIDQRPYLTTQDVLALFINDPLIGPVGGQVSYSTFGYTLASIVMEKVAGQAFPELIKAEIGHAFDVPSLEEDDPFPLKKNRISGYTQTQFLKPLNPRLTEGWANSQSSNAAYKWAGGGLLMTMQDLAKFGAAHLEGPNAKISAAERALLFTPMTPATKEMPPLGLGWRVDNDSKGRLRWHHAGAQEGSRSSLVIYPTLGLSIALASNAFGTPGNVLKPSSDLADIFAPG
jgi:serine beta-lactamase-like protein LACTB